MIERDLSFRSGLPEKTELVTALLAESLLAEQGLSSKFDTGFKPYPKQQYVYDLIDNSQVHPDKWLNFLLFGDTGGGKTWTPIGYVLRCSLKVPGCSSIFIRETKGDILLTTWKEVLELLEKWDIQLAKKNETLGYMEFMNGSKIYFRSDKTLRKSATKDKSDSLGGSQFSIAVFEEGDSVSKETFVTIAGRMRQKLPGVRKCVFVTCNPPQPHHWLFLKFNYGDRQKPPDHLKRWFIVQMMAKENPHLNDAYDEAKLEDWEDEPAFQRRMGQGLLGPETAGTPVFHRSFSRSRHVTNKDLRRAIDPNYPLWRGWDFGINHPACAVFQYDTHRGQMRVLWSIVDHDILTHEFAKKVMAQLTADLSSCAIQYEQLRWLDACDPAGADRRSTGITDVQILQALGIYPKYRRTRIGEGVDLIEEMLLSNCYQDQPTLLLDARCEMLIDALEGGYCIKGDSTSSYYETTKDGTYDHIVDAFRYAVLQVRRPGDKYQGWSHHPGEKDGWKPHLPQHRAREYYESESRSDYRPTQSIPQVLQPNGNSSRRYLLTRKRTY